MYTRILVAYDGSDSAPHVLEQALLLARSENANMDIVTVVPRYGGNLRLMGDTHILEEMHGRYEAALEQAREAALTRGVRAGTYLREGEADEEITELAKERKADLIVIGKRSRFLLDAMPVGLAAFEIIRHSPVDVLVVAGNKALHLDRLFLACGTTETGDSAARRAGELAARYGAHLTIAFTYELGMEAFTLASRLEEALIDKTKNAANRAHTLAEQAGAQRLKTMILRGDPSYKTLGEAADDDGAGLIVSCPGGERGLARLLPGMGACRLVGFSPCPVLIVKGSP